jgi:arabinogalactan endo-1,4-beta-galactosidase
MQGTRGVRTSIGVTTVALALLAGPSMRSALAQQAGVQISAVESDLARKQWVSVTASSGRDTAGRATDGDIETEWVSSRNRPGQWLKLDLGGTYDNLRKVEIVFPDEDAIYVYLIEASSDGRHWQRIGQGPHATHRGRGRVHLFTRPDTASLRVTILAASRGATIGVSEISVFNYLRDDLIVGADISYSDQNTTSEDPGSDPALRYYVDDPAEADELLPVVARAGVEYVRLRVFNDPRDERGGWFLDPAYQSPERTTTVAGWVNAENMDLGIDLHFSDSWADPSKQAKPTAWANLAFDDLVDEVYVYTYELVQDLIDQGTTPAKVAVGNEVINGFMWGRERAQPWFSDPNAWCFVCYFNMDPAFVSQPGGALLWDFFGSNDPGAIAAYDAAWDRFTTLQASGIAAVRDVAADNCVDIKVETHVIIDNGRLDKTLEFWDQYLTRLNAKGQDIDVIAHSYYPEWHGTAEHFEANLHAVAAAHPGYDLEIAETSHPSADFNGQPVPNSPYPETAQGQADALQRVFEIANDLPDNRGIGVLVWEPANWQEMIDWTSSSWPVIKFFGSINIYNQSDADRILENRVYVTTRAGRTPRLPTEVDVLAAATGARTSVPVEWDEPAPGVTDAPRQFTVNGRTSAGQVTAVVNVIEERH